MKIFNKRNLRSGLVLMAFSIVGIAGKASAQTGTPSCTIPPTCEDLGYVLSAADCEKRKLLYIKCPFDTSKVYCAKNMAVTPEVGDEINPREFVFKIHQIGNKLTYNTFKFMARQGFSGETVSSSSVSQERCTQICSNAGGKLPSMAELGEIFENVWMPRVEPDFTEEKCHKWLGVYMRCVNIYSNEKIGTRTSKTKRGMCNIGQSASFYESTVSDGTIGGDGCTGAGASESTVWCGCVFEHTESLD